MTALPKDVVADLRRSVAELEQKLQSALAERDEAIARQAAGAVENARLLTELHAARDRQAAGAEILRAIASTPGDAERPLQQIAETTARQFGASSVTLNIASGDERARMIRVGASSHRVGSEVSAEHLGIGGRNLPATVFRENRQIHIPDLDNLDPAFADWPTLPHARAAGARAMAGTPLRREGKAIGALIVHRDRPEPFTDQELALLQSFADQAVIAIENARLFNETKESLERQTATTDVLKVISHSSVDLETVLATLVQTVARLCRADQVYMFHQRHGLWYLVADCGLSPEASAFFRTNPFTPGRGSTSGRAALERRAILIPDVLQDSEYTLSEGQEIAGYRTTLGIPLLREDTLIGVYSICRTRVEPFTDKEIELATSFADQAVIAIENARLFNETREALERQTATADILKVIASSPSDVQPVFEAIATSANRLIGGRTTAVHRFVDDVI